MRIMRSCLLVFGVLGATACGEPSAPTVNLSNPEGVARSVVAGSHPRVFGQQAAFLEIADSSPGFAGVFVGSDGHPHVALTAHANAAAAVASVNRRWQRGIAGEAVTQALSVPALYDYRQLYNWKEELEGAVGRQVTAIGIHVTTNKVDVYSPNPSVDTKIEQQANAFGIPLGALNIVRGSSGAGMNASLTQDLAHDFRPGVRASAGIWRYLDATHFYECTLGVNAKMHTNPAPWVALTASHCTARTGGGTDGSAMYQGGEWLTFNSSYYMGYEVADPYWSTTGCDTGYTYCRASDVAEIGYASSGAVADSGYIAVTVARDTYYTTTWLSRDSLRIVDGIWDDQPWEGVSLDHVGAKTGWHSGTVTAACMDFPGGAPDLDSTYEYQCLTVDSSLFNFGDSGGPVFSNGPGKTVSFAGILSRFLVAGDTTKFAFSSYINICADYAFCPVVEKIWP
jgi:hypothetical protein